MNILLEVQDNKAAFLIELLSNFRFVRKAIPLTDAKAELMNDIREAVEELRLVRQGKLETLDAETLLDEL